LFSNIPFGPASQIIKDKVRSIRQRAKQQQATSQTHATHGGGTSTYEFWRLNNLWPPKSVSIDREYFESYVALLC